MQPDVGPPFPPPSPPGQKKTPGFKVGLDLHRVGFKRGHPVTDRAMPRSLAGDTGIAVDAGAWRPAMHDCRLP